MTSGQQLYKYRSDQSYPAFAHCSSDANFGTGDPATADTVGQLNAMVDYDETTLADNFLDWSVTLRTRSVSTQTTTFPAPASLTVDVSPRRVQQ